MNTTGRSSAGIWSLQLIARVEVGGDPQVQDADASRSMAPVVPDPQKMHGVFVGLLPRICVMICAGIFPKARWSASRCPTIRCGCWHKGGARPLRMKSSMNESDRPEAV